MGEKTPRPTYRCPHCAAVVQRSGQETCTYCGGLLTVVPSQPDAFAWLRAHPSFPELMAYEPRGSGEPGVPGWRFLLVLGVVLVGAGVVQVLRGEPWGLGAIGLGVAGGIAVYGYTAYDTWLREQPLTRRPARVVSLGDHQHFRVVLQFEDGEVAEFRSWSETPRGVFVGSLGVSYTRVNHLVDFRVAE